MVALLRSLVGLVGTSVEAGSIRDIASLGSTRSFSSAKFDLCWQMNGDTDPARVLDTLRASVSEIRLQAL